MHQVRELSYIIVIIIKSIDTDFYSKVLVLKVRNLWVFNKIKRGLSLRKVDLLQETARNVTGIA